ncbi:MAG: hypothetical protein L3K06_01735, partial [Thermoplasmata archaeon]|nr:hypothetical protein [Thermoplasmata archaeon]
AAPPRASRPREALPELASDHRPAGASALNESSDRSDPEDRAAARPPIPGPTARTLLLFEFVVLIEYWLAPVFLDIGNYVGIWSDIGVGLFLGLISTLTFTVLWPLRARLAPALAVPRLRFTFHGLWLGSVVVGLFATATFRLASASAFAGAPGLQVQWDAVATPFGAWPTLMFSYAPLDLIGALNAEVLSLLGVLSVVWASVVVLGMARPAARCEAPSRAVPRWRRATALLMWGPLGFMTGCSSCTPIYVAVLGVIAPGSALSAYNSIPLVPWIGLAGLLYVASLAITLRLLRRVTDDATLAPTSPSVPFALAEVSA